MQTDAATRANTTDVLERLANEVRSWPRIDPPAATVAVRADLITASYAEVDRLRARVQSLLEANNEYLERARAAERQRDAVLLAFRSMARMIHHMIEAEVGS